MELFDGKIAPRHLLSLEHGLPLGLTSELQFLSYRGLRIRIIPRGTSSILSRQISFTTKEKAGFPIYGFLATERIIERKALPTAAPAKARVVAPAPRGLVTSYIEIR